MLEAVVSSTIRCLAELLLSEARWLQGIRGHLEQIGEKLRRIKNISTIAEFRQEDQMIRQWVADTREVAYEAEDILAIIAVELCLGQGNSFRKKSGLWHKFIALNGLGPRILSISTKLSSLETDLRISTLTSIVEGDVATSASVRNQQTRISYSHDIEDFVGLDEDTEKLVAELVNEEGDKCHHVVSIIGQGGIGKTAFARKVYHHGDVHCHFQAFAWACVSPHWQVKYILQMILKKLVPEKRKEISLVEDVPELIEELSRVQESKKCLVVLDDVWGMDLWDSLKSAFPNTNLGSKVLLTTRNQKIALDIGTYTTCSLYEQRYLNDEESWELLQKKAFDRIRTGGIRTDKENLGKKMVRLCGGMPLAIIVLGGLLRTMSTLSQWEEVHGKFKLYIRKGRSFGEYGEVYKVLTLSYNDLPYQLKPCFLYLGNFPENYIIPTRKLYELWSAEGILLPDSAVGEEEQSITDIAERYLRELMQRCMVQVRVESSTGQLKSCQLHHLTRELCILKGNEENFLKRIPMSFEGELTRFPRRLSISLDSDFRKYFSGQNLESLRSAFFFSRLNDRKQLQHALKWLCKSSKLLRALDLERSDFGHKLTKAIGNLVHLRYLSLRDSQFCQLPSSIGNLKLLQTLDLRVHYNACLAIPDVLSKLTHLRHLYLPPRTSTKKLQLGNLINLETLKNFNTEVSDYKDIFKLTKLEKLRAIVCVEFKNLEAINDHLRLNQNHCRNISLNTYFDFQSPMEISLLQQLVGRCQLHKLDLVGHIVELPEVGHFSQGLTKLILTKSKLEEDPMVTLEKLPNLHFLILQENAYVGSEIRCSSQGFIQLRTLGIHRLQHLEDWIVEEGSMPNLLKLTIHECIRLKGVPHGVKIHFTIKEIEVVNMPEAFKNSAQEIPQEGREDFYKLTIIDTKTDHNNLQKGNPFAGLTSKFCFSVNSDRKLWQSLFLLAALDNCVFSLGKNQNICIRSHFS